MERINPAGVLRNIHINPKQTGHKDPYQIVKQDFYDMCVRRNLKLDEIALAGYLRGKSCRFGNPYTLRNKVIYKELNTSREIVAKVKRRLQTKGIIKYNSGRGKDYTEYTMLDSIMIHKRDKRVCAK